MHDMDINCDIYHNQRNHAHNEEPEDEACTYALELKLFPHSLLLFCEVFQFPCSIKEYSRKSLFLPAIIKKAGLTKVPCFGSPASPGQLLSVPFIAKGLASSGFIF
jgi:hypothetical protein